LPGPPLEIGDRIGGLAREINDNTRIVGLTWRFRRDAVCDPAMTAMRRDPAVTRASPWRGHRGDGNDRRFVAYYCFTIF
jgi:hypothetical protein